MRASKKNKPSVSAEPTVAYITTKGKQAAGKKIKPLTDADWVRPGRAATDEEMEHLVQEMMSEEGGISTKELRKQALTWRKKK